MKLLFKEETFSEDLKKALGFIDADFPWIKFRQDLKSATRELISTIGQSTYNSIHGFFDADEPDDDELEQLEAAQYAVATMAYFLYAPANDLQHGVNGRKMLTSEDSKTPFEHMLIASDDENERRSFRAINDLLMVLDEKSATWKASDEYALTHELCVRTVQDFDQFWMIGSRLLLLKLQPGLSAAERTEIIPRVGKDTLDAIKTKRKDGTDLDDEEALLLDFIQEACVYFSLSWGLPRLQMNLFPSGVLQAIRGERTTIKARSAATGNQVEQAAQLFKADADRILSQIETLVKEEDTDEEDMECPLDPKQPEFDCDDPFVST